MFHKISGDPRLKSTLDIFFRENKTLVLVQLLGGIFFFSGEKIPYIPVFNQ
jgi:hypothetical protein